MEYILRAPKNSDAAAAKTLYISVETDLDNPENGITALKARMVVDCFTGVDYFEDITPDKDIFSAYNHLKSTIEKEFKYNKDDFPFLDVILREALSESDSDIVNNEKRKKAIYNTTEYVKKHVSKDSSKNAFYTLALEDNRKVEITLCDNLNDANEVSIVVFVYAANEDKVELTLEEKCEKTMLSLYHGFEDIINDLGYYGIDLHKTGKDVVQVLFCTIMSLKFDILKMKNDVQIYSRIVDEIEKAIDSKEEI